MLASGFLPVSTMLHDFNITIGAGTDGVAGSNNDFNMQEEVDLAAKIQKVMYLNPCALSAYEAFYMATLGGATALRSVWKRTSARSQWANVTQNVFL